ncbi:MAG: NusG domain II-containing protein [Clostridia bacterium]|nr:NusG domain II-containing protein [Clostridia bacterium]
MRKKDWLMIGIVLVLAAGLYLASPLWKPTAQEDQIVVMVDKQEFARIPLSEPQTLTVAQTNGSTNVIEITQDGAYMKESTCQGHDCILQGPVTLDNYEIRVNQSFIICLPNKVTVELQVAKP